jgi:GTP:adenosylcobinamide-phosphate guanylyltransferase
MQDIVVRRQGMDAVVIAGGIPQPDEALYPYTKGNPKALLEVLGKPMVQWVLDALGGAQKVENVVLIGLRDDCGVSCAKPLSYILNQESMIENVLAGIKKVMEINPSATQVLLATADIPGITPEMVDWEIATASELDVDLCYNIVKREVIERRYPGSRRTFTKLKGMEVCGGDLHVVHTSVVSLNPEIWERLIASRKNPVKQAAIMGFDTLLLMLFRAITLDDAVRKITARLNITGKAIISPYAEMAMDVDKPHQLELMRADLARKAAP